MIGLDHDIRVSGMVPGYQRGTSGGVFRLGVQMVGITCPEEGGTGPVDAEKEIEQLQTSFSVLGSSPAD